MEESYIPSYRFESSEMADEFIARLKSTGIHYGIEKRGNKIWITWSVADDIRATKIKNDMLDASLSKE